MSNLQEIWKDIPGYEGYYQVSNLGRIKSFGRLTNVKNGFTAFKKGRIRTPCVSPNGYSYVSLYIEGKSKQFLIHRLVAYAFCEMRDGTDCVNHIDGDKSNNSACNLEWVTQVENMAHAVKNNLHNPPRGIRAGNNVLSEKQAIEIKTLCKTKTAEEIRVLLGYPKEKRYLIANIKCGRIWKHLKIS